jgi:hypothetical protein
MPRVPSHRMFIDGQCMDDLAGVKVRFGWRGGVCAGGFSFLPVPSHASRAKVSPPLRGGLRAFPPPSTAMSRCLTPWATPWARVGRDVARGGADRGRLRDTPLRALSRFTTLKAQAWRARLFVFGPPAAAAAASPDAYLVTATCRALGALPCQGAAWACGTAGRHRLVRPPAGPRWRPPGGCEGLAVPSPPGVDAPLDTSASLAAPHPAAWPADALSERASGSFARQGRAWRSLPAGVGGRGDGARLPLGGGGQRKWRPAPGGARSRKKRGWAALFSFKAAAAGGGLALALVRTRHPRGAVCGTCPTDCARRTAVPATGRAAATARGGGPRGD